MCRTCNRSENNLEQHYLKTLASVPITPGAKVPSTRGKRTDAVFFFFFFTCRLQFLLVQNDRVLVLTSQRSLRDIVRAVVSVNLPVLPVYIGLRQGTQALQELWVKHQVVCFYDILSQLQFCFGSDEAVSLRRNQSHVSLEDRLRKIDHRVLGIYIYIYKEKITPHLARGSSNFLNRFGIFGILEVEAKFEDSGDGETKRNAGLGGTFFQGEVHVVRVGLECLKVKII